MTRGDLRTLVLTWLDDVQAGYFTVDQVDTWINNAQYEVQKQLLDCGELWYLTCATANTVASQDSYSLPADFLKAHRVELLLAGTITSPPSTQTWTSIEPNTLNEGAYLNFGISQPNTFTIGKDCFILRPIPDAAYTMRLWYSYCVAPMTDDLNVPDVPIQYHEAIAVRAAWDGYLKDQRDPSIISTKRAYYDDMMKKDQIQRQRMRPRRVVRYGDDAGFGFDGSAF